MIKQAKKYILAFEKEKQERVFELIKDQGSIEVIENDKQNKPQEVVEDTLKKTDYLNSSLEFVIGQLTPYAHKKSLLERIKYPKIIVKGSDITGFDKEQEIENLISRVVDIQKQTSSLADEQKEQKRKLSELETLGNLEFVPQDTEYTFSSIIVLPQNKSEEFLAQALTKGVYQRQLSVMSSKIYLLLIGLLKDKQDTLKLIKDYKGEMVEYRFNQEPQKQKQIIKQEIKESEIKIKGYKAELAKMSLELDKVKIAYDVFKEQKTLIEIKKQCLGDCLLSYVQFWALEDDKQELEKRLKNVSSKITIIEAGLKKEEKAPVVLKNSNAVRPFEYVTEIFGLPRGDEIDPTPYLAFFFILFFGICITDAGYGIILALLTGLGMYFIKELRKNKLIKLMFYGGIATFIVGVLFGSYFGAAPAVFKIGFMEKFWLIDPIKDTVLFMMIAFGLGYLQLFVAQIIKIISGKRNNNKEMLASGIAWTSAYIFGAILLLSIKVPSLKGIGLFGLGVSGVALLLAESIGVKVFLKPLAGGVKVLQGLINTMSDILSYSRLMALGLSTAVIALIVNQIAGLFSGMIPFVGWLVGGLILIGGHLFNLSINALSGFIHSGRLQFVEFFPKFLEGGGKRLKPSRSELKYIKVEESLVKN